MSDLPRLLSSFSQDHRAAARQHALHTAATRARLQRASARILEQVTDDLPALLARQILAEHAEAQVGLPEEMQRRLEALAGGGAHLGRAIALLVADDRGLCWPVEVALELGAEPAALYTFRLQDDAALQASRVAHTAARRQLLPPGRGLVMWDLPGTRAAALEGPSLGLALLAAVWSAAHGVVLPETWAFTGALASQGGGVASVGHVPAKLQAAQEHGCVRVVLPRADWSPELAQAFDLELCPVATDVELLRLLGELLPGAAPEAARPTPPPRDPPRRAAVVALALTLSFMAWLSLPGPDQPPALDAAPPEQPPALYPPAPDRPLHAPAQGEHPVLPGPAVLHRLAPGTQPAITVVLRDDAAMARATAPCVGDLRRVDHLTDPQAALVCLLRRAAEDGARAVALDLLLSAEAPAWQPGPSDAARAHLDAALQQLHDRNIPVYAAWSPDPSVLQPCAAGRTALCVDGLLDVDVGSRRPTEALACLGQRPTLAWAVALALHQPEGWRSRVPSCVRAPQPLTTLPAAPGERPWRTLSGSALLGEAGALKDQVVLLGGPVSDANTSHPDAFDVPSEGADVRLAGAELHAWLALHLPAEVP